MIVILNIIFTPLLILYPFMSMNERWRIVEDGRRGLHVSGKPASPPIFDLWRSLANKEFRTLFLHRLKCSNIAGKILSHVFSLFSPPPAGLIIYTRDIGGGLIIQHGIATIIAARSIGRNCWINQQVTIGYTNDTDCPTLGDNVTVGAGAKVLGNVRVGNNVIIGANAVVVKDVPDDCVVVGVPARIIRRDGIRVDESL